MRAGDLLSIVGGGNAELSRAVRALENDWLGCGRCRFESVAGDFDLLCARGALHDLSGVFGANLKRLLATGATENLKTHWAPLFSRTY